MDLCMLHLECSENIRERNGLVGSVFLLPCWSVELCLRIYECFWTLVTHRQGFWRNREKEGWGLESLGRLDPLATHLWCSRDWPEYGAVWEKGRLKGKQHQEEGNLEGREAKEPKGRRGKRGTAREGENRWPQGPKVWADEICIKILHTF